MESVELTKLAIYSITIITCTMVLAGGVVGAVAFGRTREGAAKSFGLLFQRGNFLRIATVYFVVLAVMLLALLGKLNEGAAAALSGVAGFVLGGLDRGKGTEKEAIEKAE
jgi:hypothetical protein